MADFILIEQPEILVIMWVAESILNDIVLCFNDRFSHEALRNLDDPGTDSEREVEVELKVGVGGLLLGVALLLGCAYWDFIPHFVFLILVGCSVVMAGFNLLFVNLPAYFFWRQTLATGPRGKRMADDSRPAEAHTRALYLGAAVFFGLCWLLTGSLIFSGAIISSLNYSFGVSRYITGVERSEDVTTPADLPEHSPPHPSDQAES